MSDVKTPLNVIKIPHTPLFDPRTLQVSREWLYFFDNVGKVVDETIQANLSDMTKKILDGAGNIASLQGDTQAIQDEIVDIKQENITVNIRIDLLGARVASNESAIGKLQNTLSSVQSSLQDLQAQVTGVNDRLVVVEGKLP